MYTYSKPLLNRYAGVDALKFVCVNKGHSHLNTYINRNVKKLLAVENSDDNVLIKFLSTFTIFALIAKFV